MQCVNSVSSDGRNFLIIYSIIIIFEYTLYNIRSFIHSSIACIFFSENIVYRNHFYCRTLYLKLQFPFVWFYAWAWFLYVLYIVCIILLSQFDAHMILACKKDEKKPSQQFLSIRSQQEQNQQKKCRRKNKLPTTWNSLLLSAKIVIYNQSKVSLALTHPHPQCYWIVLSMFHTILTIFANHFTSSPFSSCCCY